MYYGKVTSIELLLDYSYPASIGKQNFTLQLLIQKERNFPQIV